MTRFLMLAVAGVLLAGCASTDTPDLDGTGVEAVDSDGPERSTRTAEEQQRIDDAMAESLLRDEDVEEPPPQVFDTEGRRLGPEGLAPDWYRANESTKTHWRGYGYTRASEDIMTNSAGLFGARRATNELTQRVSDATGITDLDGVDALIKLYRNEFDTPNIIDSSPKRTANDTSESAGGDRFFWFEIYSNPGMLESATTYVLEEADDLTRLERDALQRIREAARSM